MKLLTLDTENVYGIMHPWEDGFYCTLLCAQSGESQRYFWFTHNSVLPTPNAIPTLQELIDQHDILCCHNMKYDLHVLRWLGLDLNNIQLYDTMVAEYLIQGQNPKLSYSLKECAERYKLPSKLDVVAAMWDDEIETKDIDPLVLTEYCARDVETTQLLMEKQAPIIQKQGQEALVKLQCEYVQVLCDIEANGFVFDESRATEMLDKYAAKLIEIETELREIAGEPELNIGSPPQRSAFLFGGTCKIPYTEWVIKTYKTVPYSTYKEVTKDVEKQLEGIGFRPPNFVKPGAAGYYSTDKTCIEQLTCRTKTQRRVKSLLLEFSAINKMVSSILGKGGATGLLTKIGRDGLIHPTLNNITTSTGRLSSSNPNSQNLPRGNTSPIKCAIVPRYDGIYQVDLSQIEWRAAAELSGDEVMIREVNSKIDQHAAAVVDIMELEFKGKDDPKSKENRTNAKVVNFRMIYRGSAYGFYRDPRMPNFSLKKWENICDKFYDKYAGLKQWQDANIELGNREGILVIPTGRRFHFVANAGDDGVPVYNERQFANYPVQGISGGDILPLMAVIIRRGLVKYQFKSKLILTVHDSLVFDYVQEELERLNRLCLMVAKQLPQYIEAYFGFKWHTRLDAEAEIGPNYGELKFYKET